MAKTLHQRRTHPELVEGCFACRVGTVGFDGKHMTGTTVVREPMVVSVPDGRGGLATQRIDRVKNEVTEHRDGRVDVTIKAPTVKLKATTREERD